LEKYVIGGKKIVEGNFEINESSLQEFCRILLPEALLNEHKALIKYEEDKIVLDLKKDKESISFQCISYEDKIYDQKLVMLKSALLKFYNKDYKWGGMIGVRPTKIVRRFLEQGYTYEEIRIILKNLYLVKDEKIQLLETIVKKELEYLNRKYINLYLGIPYCPSKCKYCSFASYELKGKQGEAYNKFVETLLEEIKLTGDFFKEKNIPIESIYIGGGTPTILNENDLELILKELTNNINMDNIKEFTVEAGRIDTLNLKKLEIMKRYAVDRISINPQTFNEEVLKDLNRFFDSNLFDYIFSEAKKMDFIINMDLIIGLPNERTEDILKTLDKVENYSMDNLTIHVLALKKASTLFKSDYEHNFINYELINNKISELTKKKGLYPYYMYRQKNSLDWGENVAYAILGKESIFNIEMIEENQSTFALGGGGISKIIKDIGEGRDSIERIINPKEPIAYINIMEERFKKKVEVFSKWIAE